MIRAVKNIIIFMTIIFASVAMVNYFVDPLNSHHFEKEEMMVDYLCQGKTIYYSPNYNERLLQKIYINKIDNAPKTVVLGASRGMLLDRKITGYEDLFNNCVSSASFEEITLMLGLYYQKGDLPERVIIEVGPWNFNDNRPERLNGTDKELYHNFCSIMTRDGKKYRARQQIAFDAQNLFSFTLFQDSLSILLNRGLNISKERAQVYTIKPDDTYFSKFSDGSIQYGSRTRNKSDSEILQELESNVGGTIFNGFSGFREVGKKTVKQFEAIITWLNSQNIQVVIYMAPFPPIIYDFCMGTDYAAMVDVEQYLLEKSKEFGYEVRGSFNPANIGLSDTDFYDSVHPKKEVTPDVWNFLR